MGKSSSRKIQKEFKNLRKNLLDLTLRNQLLNFKQRNQTLKFDKQSPSNIYKMLVLQKKKMNFSPKGKDSEESSKWSFHKPQLFSDDKTLEVNLTPNELQKRLFYINNQSKTMLQEQGYNILYVAVGFLNWSDKSKPRQSNLAPLILIPVTLERKKAGNSFSLYWTGEDIQTNISLKTKLLDDGIEVDDFEAKNFIEAPEQYIKHIENAVKPMRKWKIDDKLSVALGFFSFTKFIMYNDLNPDSWKDNVDLTNHPLINAIFDPSVNKQEAFKEEDIYSELHYEDMYQVLDADSSQIAAIEDVKSGRNLVVEGPPGTGKSQTIVNLIAELLAEGKTVLFVSEKMAALDVVKNRLIGVGLGKFVLELHSHKTRRKKFLKDLQKSANVRAVDDFNIDQTLRKLENLKVQLDDYADIIHKPLYEVQMSPYELYGIKEYAEEHFQNQSKMLPLVNFDNPRIITMKDLDDMVISLENLAELHQTINKDNPWSDCAPDSLLPSDLREIELLIRDALNSLDLFLEYASNASTNYGLREINNLNDFYKSTMGLDFIEPKNIPFSDMSLINKSVWITNSKKANELIELLEVYQSSKKFISKFTPEVFNEDLDDIINKVQESSNKRFKLFSSSNSKKLVKDIYKSNIPKDKTIVDDLNKVKKFILIKDKLESNSSLGKEYFGIYWTDDCDINILKKIYSWITKLNELINEGSLSENIRGYLSNDLNNTSLKDNLKDFISSGEDFNKKLTKLDNKLHPNTDLLFKSSLTKVPLKSWIMQLNKWKGQLSSLHLWSQYLKTKNECLKTDSKLFIESIEKRNISKDDVSQLVLGNFADSLLNIVFSENEELASFIGELHQNRIKEFVDLDRKILKLNRKRIFNKLNKNIPKIFGGADNPEASILAGEFTRKSGHMPVRKLLENAGGIIKQIKPVFMMSPLSIAQYLDPTNPKLQFDVVIFDEASQVKPEDALGAFMRGKTAVVMGDTQQLPPTSFFDQIAEGDSHEELATSLDMESILHLCKLSFPVKMLKWHYRSRHESLISLSNREFYDNQLLVYPSPSHNDPELGLKFRYSPDTIYERGSGSYNRGEAKLVVKEIFNHFDKYGDTKSIGVGTFSVAQRNAILEELEIERKQRPELEPLFSDKREERFFVKNLETIQGDERDVILISVGYGYDENRKMSLNFGPLNQEGGERRLNVLITRAREKCLVFSNFKAYDIHITANPPFGVRALKEFLEYAETLTMGTYKNEDNEVESFVKAIYSFLVENGYEVEKNIGCAGFRVDLAIVDTENPGRYLMGITTDGKMYTSSKVARDRDRLREQVLNGLGWKLYHLWSTDWYRNREVSKQRLLDFIEETKVQVLKDDEKKAEELKKLKEKREIERQKRLEEAKAIEEAKLKEEMENDENIISDDTSLDNDVDENTSLDNNEDSDFEDNEPPLTIDEVNNLESIDLPQDKSGEEIIVIDPDSNKEGSDIEPRLNEINLDSSKEEVNEVNIKKTTQSEPNVEKKVIDYDINPFNEEYISDDMDYESIEKTSNNEKLPSKKEGSDSNNLSFKHSKPTSKKIIKSPKKKQKTTSTTKSKQNENSIKKGISNPLNSIRNKLINQSSKDSNKDLIEEDSLNNSDDLDSNKYIVKEDLINNNELKTNNDTLKNDKVIFNDSKLKESKKDIELNEIDKPSKKQDSNKAQVIADDEEYEYIEVPIDQELSDGEEFVEFVGEDNDDDFESLLNSLNSEEKPKIKFRKKLNNDEDELEEIISTVINDGADLSKDSNNEIGIGDNIVSFNQELNDNKDILDNEDKINSNSPTSYNEDVHIKRSEDNLIDNNVDLLDDVLSEVDSKDSLLDDVIGEEGSNDILLGESPSEVGYSGNLLDEVINEVDTTEKVSANLEIDDNLLDKDNIYSIEDYDNDEYYDAEEYDSSTDLTYQLNKNNVYYKDSNKDDSLRGKISKFKKDMQYINESLKEIENPSHSETIHTIDRSRKIRPKTITDEDLEHIIEDVDQDYKDVEKERFKENNILKNHDDSKLPKKNKTLDSVIVDYKEVDDIGIKSQDELYSKSNEEVSQAINKIIKQEGPLHKDDLIKRFKEQCNIKRAGSKLKNLIDDSLKVSEESNVVVIDEFIYDVNQESILIRKRLKPNIDLISPEEIEANIKAILEFTPVMDVKDLTKQTAKNFGFKSTSKKTSARINVVMDAMLASGKLSSNKGDIELN